MDIWLLSCLFLSVQVCSVVHAAEHRNEQDSCDVAQKHVIHVRYVFICTTSVGTNLIEWLRRVDSIPGHVESLRCDAMRCDVPACEPLLRKSAFAICVAMLLVAALLSPFAMETSGPGTIYT